MKAKAKAQWSKFGHEAKICTEECEREGAECIVHKNTSNWADDKVNGLGRMIFEDGTVYEGYYVNNCKSGYGKTFYPDSSWHVGFYKNGMQEGFGLYSYAPSNLEQVGGKVHSELDDSQRQPIIGDLERQGPSDQASKHEEEEPMRASACASFMNNFRFLCCCFNHMCKASHGPIKCATYSGDFRCGQKDGNGCFTDEEGNSAKGHWKNNEWVKWAS